MKKIGFFLVVIGILVLGVGICMPVFNFDSSSDEENNVEKIDEKPQELVEVDKKFKESDHYLELLEMYEFNTVIEKNKYVISYTVIKDGKEGELVFGYKDGILSTNLVNNDFITLNTILVGGVIWGVAAYQGYEVEELSNIFDTVDVFELTFENNGIKYFINAEEEIIEFAINVKDKVSFYQ